MNRKFRVLFGLLGMLMFIMVFNIPALTQEYCYQTIAAIVGSANTETGNPAIHLIDEIRVTCGSWPQARHEGGSFWLKR